MGLVDKTKRFSTLPCSRLRRSVDGGSFPRQTSAGKVYLILAGGLWISLQPEHGMFFYLEVFKDFVSPGGRDKIKPFLRP